MLTGETLRLLRQTRQIKQKEMARQLGISQQRYSALESGPKIPENKVPIILDTLRYSPEELEKILVLFRR